MTPNIDTSLLKLGTRQALFLSKETFKKKFLLCATKLNREDEYFSTKNSDKEEMALRYIINLKKVKEDLSRVAFSRDGLTIGNSLWDFETGFSSTRKGFSFYSAVSGDEMEAPVLYIIYHDGKSWRAYIPTYGNSYNIKENRAYMYDEEYEDLNKMNLTPKDLTPSMSHIMKDIEINIHEKGCKPKQLRFKF